jgi:hypothetical protein
MLLPSIATPTSMQSAVQRRPSILRSNHRHLAIVAHAQTSFELRVCTNRTCKRQGSPTVRAQLRRNKTGFRIAKPCSKRPIPVLQVLKLAKDLALEQLTVNECGCLGEVSTAAWGMLPTGATLMLWLCPHQTTVHEREYTVAKRINIASHSHAQHRLCCLLCRQLWCRAQCSPAASRRGAAPCVYAC